MVSLRVQPEMSALAWLTVMVQETEPSSFFVPVFFSTSKVWVTVTRSFRSLSWLSLPVTVAVFCAVISAPSRLMSALQR